MELISVGFFSLSLFLCFVLVWQRRQAFLEMAEEAAAISMVNYFSSGTSAQLRGRNVFVQFSNHSQLKTDQSHSNAVINTFIFLLFLCF